MKRSSFPRLVRWMLAAGLLYLLCMTIMRLVFFYHFTYGMYTFDNCFKAFALGLNFDVRIVCGIILFPFLVGSLHINYTSKKRISAASLIQVIVTLLIMVLLIIFMKKATHLWQLCYTSAFFLH